MARKPMTKKDIIREWISDNLRYMMLGLAILVVVGLIVLLIYLLSTKTGGQDTGSKQNPVTAESNVQEEKTETNSAQSGDEKTESTETAAESTSSESVEEVQEEIPEFGQNNVAGVTAICVSYYEALADKELDILRTLVDELTDEDAETITADTKVAGYHDISVYTLEGPEKGSYIAFVRYTTEYTGINTGLPMLSELYIYTGEDGKLQVMGYPEKNDEVLRAMTSAQSDAQAAELIGQVKANYELALEADPALEKLVDELS